MIYMRIICFILITLGVLFLPLWVFVPCALLYALIFSPYELVLLSVLVDAEFGNPEAGGMWYMYTLSTALILIVTTYAKPYLRFYR